MSVKICGITRAEDARAAEESGASYIGTILVPASPRFVTIDQASGIGQATTLPLAIVLVGEDPDEVARTAEATGAGVIQLHGDESADFVRKLRPLTSAEIWKAARLRTESDLRNAVERFASEVDLLLLDAWHPTALGGTGITFPWEVLEGMAPPEGLRIGVAGGLTPENVEDAIARLHPDLVDVGSGVEASPGVKDPDRVRRFIMSAQRGFARGLASADHSPTRSGRKE